MYRLIPIKPSDFELLGFCFKDKFYFDKALPFGASISCITFKGFATFVQFCVESNFDTAALIHYLDDFLGGDRTQASCLSALSIFKNTMAELGVPLADEKTEGPTEVLIHLGLELDINEMVVRIPKHKIEEVILKISEILSKRKATLKKIQSLIGSLHFCCRATVMGRSFIHRLIDSICGLSRPFHQVHFKLDMHRDLIMWQNFLVNFNGVSVFHDKYWTKNCKAQLFSDSAASKGLGFGIFFQGHWSQAKWHLRGYTSNITILEVFPILVAIFLWGSKLRKKKIEFNYDNIALVEIINKLTSKSELVMSMVRLLTLQCLKYNILIKAVHNIGFNQRTEGPESRTDGETLIFWD